MQSVYGKFMLVIQSNASNAVHFDKSNALN